MSSNNSPKTIIGILSLSEMFLGSYLHFLRIPLTGQLMSLNQCFWLNVAKNYHKKASGSKISFKVAMFKMMSPLGKKITPMIAISMQGLLFELGVIIGRRTFAGQLIGSMMMGLWALLQPCLMYSIFLGPMLPQLNRVAVSWGVNIKLLILGAITLKCLFCLAVCIFAKTCSQLHIESLKRKIQSLEAFLSTHSPRKKRVKFWKKPFFLSLFLLVPCAYFTSSGFEHFLKKSLFYLAWILLIQYLLDFISLRFIKKIPSKSFFGNK